MVKRGINLKNYYHLFVNLDNGNTEGMTKAEYRKAIFSLLAKDLEKNFLNGHIYDDEIEQIQRRDYLANLKIKYYTCGTNIESVMYINFLHDCVVINGLYIKY